MPSLPPRPQNKIIKAKVCGHQQVEFVYHALQQMELRGITTDDVLKVLRNPTQHVPDTQMGRLRARLQITYEKALDVIYEELPDRVRVITAFHKNRPKRR